MPHTLICNIHVVRSISTQCVFVFMAMILPAGELVPKICYIMSCTMTGFNIITILNENCFVSIVSLFTVRISQKTTRAHLHCVRFWGPWAGPRPPALGGAFARFTRVCFEKYSQNKPENYQSTLTLRAFLAPFSGPQTPSSRRWVCSHRSKLFWNFLSG